MGLLINDNIDNDCLLGVWEIREDYNKLLSKVSLLSRGSLFALRGGDYTNSLPKDQALIAG